MPGSQPRVRRPATPGHPSELYEKLYADWFRIERQVLCRITNGLSGKNPHRTEVIWSNREIQGRLFADDSTDQVRSHMTCPHCGAEPVERGATGLDVCTRCGGLSRDGKMLERNQSFRAFPRPTMVDATFLPVEGTYVAAVMADGHTSLSVSFLVKGKVVPPFLIMGEQAETFGKLVADALALGQRTQN